MIIRRLLRFGVLAPAMLLALLPVVASADSGLAGSIGSTATRASLGVLVPISATCPAPSSSFFPDSVFGKLRVIQASGNSNVAVGVAILASGAGKGAFGSPQPGVTLICDGSAHSYQALVVPDTQTDPYTASFTGGQATADLSLTRTTFTCGPWFCFPTNTTVSTGPVEIHIKG